MKLEFTAVFRRVPEGFIGFIEEMPGANTQGATLEEARENLREALTMLLEANRALAEEELRGQEVIREQYRMHRLAPQMVAPTQSTRRERS